MAILKHIASKSSNYGAALEYLIFKHDELRKTPILDQNGNRIIQIKLIPHDTISVLVKDRSFPKLVMLENQILQRNTIVEALTCDML